MKILFYACLLINPLLFAKDSQDISNPLNKIFNYLSSIGSLELDVFPLLAQENKLSAIKQNNVKWRSIDSHKDIEEAQKEFVTE